MIRLRFDRDVPIEMRRHIRAFATWLERKLDVDRPTDVEFCWRLDGYFEAKGDVSPKTIAVVATADGLEVALHSFAHEMVHWEQWRAQVPYTERGVNQRATALVVGWRKSCAA